MELSRLVVVEESDEALLASARSRRIDLTGRRMYHMDGRLGLPVPAPGDLKLLQRLQTRASSVSRLMKSFSSERLSGGLVHMRTILTCSRICSKVS